MEAYKDILAEHHIPLDEDLIVYTDLRRNAGPSAVNQLFSKIHDSVDAIVCVNDGLAFGVMDSFKSQGYKIPEDIAVTGSMDIAECLFSQPPLTSIQEPLYELGRQAAYQLFRKMKGVHHSDIHSIITRPILRESCGCKPASKSLDAFHPTDSKEINAHKFRQTCYKIMTKNRCDHYESLDEILILFNRALSNGQAEEFLAAIKQHLKSMVRSHHIIPWLKILSKMHHMILAISAGCIENSNYHFQLLVSLSDIKDEYQHRAIVYQSFDTDNYINFFREIVNNLNSSFDLNAVRDYAINLLNLTDLSISVYDKSSKDLSIARNVMTVRHKKSIQVDKETPYFPSNHLLPQSVPSFKEAYALIVFPLSFRKKPLGFLTLNLSDRRGSAFENMQAIISTALKNELQIEELIEAESRFSDIAHSTSDWLWETNDHHVFTYCSNSVSNTLGITGNQLVGIDIKLLSMEENPNFYDLMKNHAHLSGVECWFSYNESDISCLLMSAKPIFKEGNFTGYRGILKDITGQKLQEDRIKYLAYNDVLTGLPNRTHFNNQLRQLLVSSEASQESFALIFLDMDRFKYINDSMGHAAGDALLQKLAKRLSAVLRSNDTLARLGGDEFTLLLPSIQQISEVTTIANTILEKTASAFILNDTKVYITLSMGIALYPSDGINDITLLKNADTAMYKAKSQGKNRYVFYDRQIEETNVSRMVYDELLHRALADNNFYVHYQPKIDARSNKVIGYESLVRIKDPKKGIIFPGQFIGLAEELGIIEQVDEKVLRLVCQQYRQWSNQGIKVPLIAINLSPLELRDTKIVSKYMNILAEYDVDPTNIQLEITENALIENESMALDILTSFKNCGFSLALDDFGIGYSSLSFIQIYPIDTIKIDRSFIKDLSQNIRNRAIIEAIIQIAKTLDLSIVAEGVETKAQLTLIQQLDCHKIQGYYYSPPLAPDKAIAMLDEKYLFT